MWNWIESGCMRELVRIAPLLLAVLPVAARSAVLIPVSQSTITVTGAGLNGETYNLTKAYGDWFYTAQDAHASLTLLTGAGAHQAQLSLEWDGRALTQTIDRANNDSTVNNGTGGFVFDLHLKGTGVYGQELRPGGGDAITVTITKMDDQSLEATLAGTATGTAAVRISGAIKLHRSSAGLVSGTFGGCDPHIYDKLAGAEWRSPSECEVKFNAYVLQGLLPVVAPVESGLQAAGWTEAKKPRLDAIDSIPRGSEKKPFQLVNRGGGAFDYTFSLPPNSKVYQQYNQAAMDAMQKAMGQALKGGPAGGQAAMDAAQEAARALQENTSVGISVAINQASLEISDFKGGHTVTPLAGGGYSIEVPYAQPATGGGVDAAVRMTYVFVGAWAAAPGSTPASSGDESIQVKGVLNPAKLLAVQNLEIRIQGGTAETQQVIGAMDWNTLRGLVAK